MLGLIGQISECSVCPVPLHFSGNSLPDFITSVFLPFLEDIVQELCESRGGRPGLSVLTSLLVSVDVKNY